MEVIELARAKDILGCDAKMDVRSFPLMIDPLGSERKETLPCRPAVLSQCVVLRSVKAHTMAQRLEKECHKGLQ